MDQRREFALKVLGTPNFRALCREYGISTKTGYKWRERFLRRARKDGGRFAAAPEQSQAIERRATASSSWENQKVFLTGSLAGWEVGLQRTEKGQLEVWFGRLLLGHLDPQEVDFLRSEQAA